MRSKTSRQWRLKLMGLCVLTAATGCTDPITIGNLGEIETDVGPDGGLDMGTDGGLDAASDMGPQDAAPEDIGVVDAGALRITFIKPRITLPGAFGGSVAWLEDKLAVGASSLSDCGRNDAGVLDVRCSGQGALTVVDLSAEPDNRYTIVKPDRPTKGFSDTVVTSSTHVAVSSLLADSNSGAVESVFIFERLAGALSLPQQLTNPAPTRRFAYDVALQEDWVAVLAAGDVCQEGGVPCASDAAVHLYRNRSGLWTYEQTVTGTATGADLLEPIEVLGSVSLDSNHLAIGLPHDDRCAAPRQPCPRSGSVHMYSFNGTAFVFDETIEARLPQSDARFGAEVQLHGSTMVVGEPGRDQVLTYRLRASGWHQIGWNSILFEEAEFGAAIDIDGSRMLVGAPNEHNCSMGYADPDTWDDPCSIPNGDNPDIGTGAAFLYERVGDKWVRSLYLKPNTTIAGLDFGASVALGTNAVAVGAPKEITGASGIDPVPATVGSPTGAVFVYETREQ